MKSHINYNDYPMSFVDLFSEYDIDIRRDFTKSEIDTLVSEAINYINCNPLKDDLVVNLHKVAIVIRGIDEAGHFISAITM